MKCIACGQDVIYAGPVVPHMNRSIVVQDEAAPYRFHRCDKVNGAIQFPAWMYVVPMYDGKLILAMQLTFN